MGLASKGKDLRWFLPKGHRHTGEALSAQTRAQEQKVTFAPTAYTQVLPGLRTLGHRVILISFWGAIVLSQHKGSKVRTLI